MSLNQPFVVIIDRHPIRPLEGPGSVERARRLKRRFRAATSAARPGLRAFCRSLLAAYWLGCLVVIGLGLDSLYPDVRATLTRQALAPNTVAGFEGFATDTPRWSPRYAHPFRNCAAAHAAGVYDIPLGSPAYSPRQDGDRDGLSCEPPRGAY